MSSPTHRMWWAAQPNEPLPSTSWTVLDESSYRDNEHRNLGYHRLPGPVPYWAEDLFRLARAVFLTDKRAHREPEADGWTRHLQLSVPVTEHDRWQAPMAGHHLGTLLETLTGDTWEVTFRALSDKRPVHDPLPRADSEYAKEVSLFSGGLDSLSWAAQRAQAVPEQPPLLVMFRELKLETLQEDVHKTVERIAGGPVPLISMSQVPRRGGSDRRLEPSSRTRGLLYAAGAIRAAAAHHVDAVHIPENGQLALNPPLSAARSVACSTRSVHPWTLHHLNRLIAALEGTVRVSNPLQQLTKGQVCMAALDAGITQPELGASLSCGKPPARRKDGPAIPNCGICFPCLIRRSGLHHACEVDTTHYETAPWTGKLSSSATEDWRALRRWLHNDFTAQDLIADTPLPPGTRAADFLPTLRQGRAELKEFVRSGNGTPDNEAG